MQRRWSSGFGISLHDHCCGPDYGTRSGMYQHDRSSAVKAPHVSCLTMKNPANMYKTAAYGCVRFPERHPGLRLQYLRFFWLGVLMSRNIERAENRERR